MDFISVLHFLEPGGAADKVQKVLTLEHGLQLEIYIERRQPDLNFLNRGHGSRKSGRSIRR